MTPEERADQFVRLLWEKNAFHPNMDESDRVRNALTAIIRAAVFDERQACAKVAEAAIREYRGGICEYIAAQIRARGSNRENPPCQ